MALGSNIGDRVAQLNRAISALQSQQILVRAASPVYETAPWGLTEQDNFLNACLTIETSLLPSELLQVCKKIELELGRKKEVHWGPREIDIDILFYGSELISKADLSIPHSEIANRQFVLKPLTDLAPNLIHPTLQQTIQELSAKLPMEGINLQNQIELII